MKSTPNSSLAFPMMMVQLSMASWETIFHRTMLMYRGSCTAAEYQRMFAEKAKAAQISTLALMTGKGEAAVVAPYLTRARANARRLRSQL
jgi:hypothetical protein